MRTNANIKVIICLCLMSFLSLLFQNCSPIISSSGDNTSSANTNLSSTGDVVLSKDTIEVDLNDPTQDNSIRVTLHENSNKEIRFVWNLKEKKSDGLVTENTVLGRMGGNFLLTPNFRMPHTILIFGLISASDDAVAAHLYVEASTDTGLNIIIPIKFVRRTPPPIDPAPPGPAIVASVSDVNNKDFKYLEGETIKFKINLSAPAANDLSVNYSLIPDDVAAVNSPLDFVNSSPKETISIKKGQTSSDTIEVLTRDNATFEGPIGVNARKWLFSASEVTYRAFTIKAVPFIILDNEQPDLVVDQLELQGTNPNTSPHDFNKDVAIMYLVASEFDGNVNMECENCKFLYKNHMSIPAADITTINNTQTLSVKSGDKIAVTVRSSAQPLSEVSAKVKVNDKELEFKIKTRDFKSCTLPFQQNGSNILGHNSEVKAFKTVDNRNAQATCEHEFRKCNDGVLSGSFQYPTCTELVLDEPSLLGFQQMTFPLVEPGAIYESSPFKIEGINQKLVMFCNNPSCLDLKKNGVSHGRRVVDVQNNDLISIVAKAANTFDTIVVVDINFERIDSTLGASKPLATRKGKSCSVSTQEFTQPTGSPPTYKTVVETLNHEQSLELYSASLIEYPDTCVKQTRTCNDGELSGTHSHKTCKQTRDLTPDQVIANVKIEDTMPGDKYVSPEVEISGINGSAYLRCAVMKEMPTYTNIFPCLALYVNGLKYETPQTTSGAIFAPVKNGDKVKWEIPSPTENNYVTQTFKVGIKDDNSPYASEFYYGWAEGSLTSGIRNGTVDGCAPIAGRNEYRVTYGSSGSSQRITLDFEVGTNKVNVHTAQSSAGGLATDWKWHKCTYTIAPDNSSYSLNLNTCSLHDSGGPYVSSMPVYWWNMYPGKFNFTNDCKKMQGHFTGDLSP